MNEKLRKWRRDGLNLPRFLRDFHDQKSVFRVVHELVSCEEYGVDPMKGHGYVIDCFLWVMARHGYTLQKSRANLEFDSLPALRGFCPGPGRFAS